MSPAIRIAATLALAAALASPAAAHEFWLQPSIAKGPAGTPWTVAGFVGTGFHGEARPYNAARAVRFELRGGPKGGGGPVTDLRPRGNEGESPWYAGTLEGKAGALIVYETNFATIEMPGTEFDAYLKLEGLEHVRTARAAAIATLAPGRERYRRACKAWIAGTESSRDRATEAAGLPLEIVPDQVPGSLPRFAFRVFYQDKPLANALVRAWHHPPGSPGDSVGISAEVRTDEKGRAAIPLTGPGTWLVSTVHMVKSADREMADWESTWASYTFGF